MTPIFRKELRAGIPFACLMVLVRIVEEISGWVTGYPDIYSLGDMIGQGGGSLEGPLIYFLLCFAYGYGLLIREKDEGTLEFLDALPASRTQIYLGKILAGCVIVAAMPLTWNTTLLVHGWLGRDSLETSLYLFDSFWTFLVEWFAGIVYLGIAVALSFLRRFAFLVLALLFLGYLKLSTMDLSWVRWLNILEVFDYTYYGSHPVPPWGKIAVAGAIGIAGFLAAYFAYLAQGDRMGRVAGALDRRGCLKPLLAAGAVSVVLVWLGIFIYYSIKSEPDYDPDAEREVQVVYESWETSRASGGGYDFIYPANLESRAEGLIELAGETHRQVREFLGVPQVDGAIVANLGSNDPHFAGTAVWKRVNMNLYISDDPAELAAVLGHETTHVYIEAGSESEFTDKFGSTRWYHEGLASYVEFRFFRPPEALPRLRRVAAAAYDKKIVRLERLINNADWSAEHDPHLVYALGEVFCAALVARYGDEAPGRVVRAFARDGAPDLAGVRLWQDAMQSCGYSLSAAESEFYALLKAEAEAYRELLDSLPRLTGRVYQDEFWAGIQPLDKDGDPPDLPEGWELRVRFRMNEGDAESDYLGADHIDGGTFFLSRDRFPGRRLQYQIGVFNRELVEMPIYEDWASARL